jgi:hypothetical protein
MGNPFISYRLACRQSCRPSKSHFSGKKIVSLAQKLFGANPSHPAIYRRVQHDDEPPEKQVVFAGVQSGGRIRPRIVPKLGMILLERFGPPMPMLAIGAPAFPWPDTNRGPPIRSKPHVQNALAECPAVLWSCR